ncbi:MAG: response regulator, partial [Bacteroidales bacterium]
EESLRVRLSYEQLLSRVSVLAMETEDLYVFQNKCLKAMGETLNVSRIYIFEHHHETDTMDNTFEWVGEGVLPQKDELQGVSAADSPWWMKVLKSNIVKQNNGFINVYSEPSQGSTFKIYLPRLVADEEIDKAVPQKKAAAGGTETILLVEDEPSILRMTRMMLEKKGYSVLSAVTPAEAVEKAKNHSGAIDLLMTDVVMPGMNGRALAGQITDLYPDIRLLFMSGYTANVIAHQGILDDGVSFIQKPFSMADMTEKGRELLDMVSDKD